MALAKTYTRDIKYTATDVDMCGKAGISNEITENVVFENAYFVISNVAGGKDGLEIRVNAYADSSKLTIYGSLKYTFVPSVAEDSENFIKQGYEFLKTLPDYMDAVDC